MRLTRALLSQVIRQYVPPDRRPNRIGPGLWQTLAQLRIRIIGQPRVVANESIKRALKAVEDMPKEGYYAVHTGHVPGIYRTWPEAEAQVKGYPAAKFKKFPTEAAAKAFIGPPASSTAPYSAPSRQSPNAIAGPSSHSENSNTSAPARIPQNRPDSSSRAVSPPTSIDPSLLPSDLQAIAEAGYTFSRDKRLVVYTDGSGLGNGQRGAKAGLGVYWGDRGQAGKRNLSERVPGELQTNNRGELLSVIRAIEECPYPSLPLEIRTDSQYTIGCMTTYLAKWMKNGFRTSSKQTPFSQNGQRTSGSKGQSIKNADMIKHLLVLLRRRHHTASVRFKYVAGHVGWEGNEAADKLAKRGALMPVLPDRSDWLDPDDEDDALEEYVEENKRVDIDFEIDESWLMTEEEMYSLERDFRKENQ